MHRTDVTFSSGGLDCAAWCYRPAGTGPHPLVVMGHGFGATRELALDAYAERYATAGIGALLFDYRHFGASSGEPRQLLDIALQQHDYRAALACAKAIDWVDPARVALFGSSFSAGHAVRVAASDPSVAAVLALCPFMDGVETAMALGLRNVLGLAAAGLFDELGGRIGRAPFYIPAVGPPGTLAAMNSPDADPGMRALVPASSTWRNEVSARIALRFALYRPGRRARRLRCPALWCVCDHDVIAPAPAALRAAAAAPRGELRRYPCGHFDIYRGEIFEQAVGDQVDFLTRHLLDARVAS